MWFEIFPLIPSDRKSENMTYFIKTESRETAIKYLIQMFGFNMDNYSIYDSKGMLYLIDEYYTLEEASEYIRNDNPNYIYDIMDHKRQKKRIPKNKRYITFNKFLTNFELKKIIYVD